MKSAKEKYDEEMSRVRDSSRSEQDIEDEEIAEQTKQVEAEMDKKVVSMTNSEHLAKKGREQEAAALKSLQRLNTASKYHLSAEDKKKIMLVAELYKAENLADPVLLHLIQRRIELHERHEAAQKKVKELYQQMLKEISEVSEETMKTVGTIEHTDREIVAMVTDNPSLLDGGEDLPPSA